MTTGANDVLKSFERLSAGEQQEVASEILRRVIDLETPPLSDDQLAQLADELFVELDRSEEADASG